MNELVIAERLRDEVKLYDVKELRYVNGKIEVHVGWWAWERIREIYTEEHFEDEKKQIETVTNIPVDKRP